MFLCISNYKVKTILDCGMIPTGSSPRIFGGSEVTPYSLPWQVVIVEQDSRYLRCGGTLISDRHVLTSVFCADDITSLEVIVGIHNLNSLEGATRHRICKFITHPDYAETNVAIPIRDTGDDITYVANPQYSFDFAIFHLLTPVEIIPRVAPACLPPPSFTDDFLDGKPLEVSGWGWKNESYPSADVLDNYLHSTTVFSIRNKQCNNEYNNFLRLVNSTIDFDLIDESMFCAFQPNGGPCAFRNDFGGK